MTDPPATPSAPPNTLEYGTPGTRIGGDNLTKSAPTILVISSCCAGVLLLISLWRVHEFGVPRGSTCLALPLGLAGAILWFIGCVFLLQGPRDHCRTNLRWILAPMVLAVSALALAKTTAVPRAYFALNRSAFDREVAQLQSAGLPGVNPRSSRELPFDRSVRGFHVDVVGVDSAGGLWFRTGTYSAMIDEGSVGFYYRAPNTTTPINMYGAPTSPFGAADLRFTDLGGGWYFFDVTDDWF